MCLWDLLDCLYKGKGHVPQTVKTQLPRFLHNKDAFRPALSDHCTQQALLGSCKRFIPHPHVFFCDQVFNILFHLLRCIRTSVKISSPGTIAFTIKLLVCWEKRNAFQGTLILNFIIFTEDILVSSLGLHLSDLIRNLKKSLQGCFT